MHKFDYDTIKLFICLRLSNTSEITGEFGDQVEYFSESNFTL